MNAPDYLLIGHMTADITPDGGRIRGGTVSYAAPVAKAFGHRVGLLTSAAPEDALLRPLAAVADVALRVADATTTFENRYLPEGRVQHVHHRAAPLTPEWLPVGWLDAPRVHLAPLINEVDPAFAALFDEAVVMLTPQGYMRRTDDTGRVHFRRWLDSDMLRAVDLLVLSREDIAPAPDLESAFAASVAHCIVTDGAKGGTYYHRGDPHAYDAIQVTETDPTGAGDVFAAALLAGLSQKSLTQDALWQALNVARELAAKAVTQKGSGHISQAAVQNALATVRGSDSSDTT